MKARSSSSSAKIKVTEYRIPLEHDFYVLVRYELSRGRIEKYAAVLLRLHEDGESQDQICRYDNAHGFAHLDLLSRRGKIIEKRTFENSDFREALIYAIHNLKANYQKWWKELRQD